MTLISVSQHQRLRGAGSTAAACVGHRSWAEHAHPATALARARPRARTGARPCTLSLAPPPFLPLRAPRPAHPLPPRTHATPTPSRAPRAPARTRTLVPYGHRILTDDLFAPHPARPPSARPRTLYTTRPSASVTHMPTSAARSRSVSHISQSSALQVCIHCNYKSSINKHPWLHPWLVTHSRRGWPGDVAGKARWRRCVRAQPGRYEGKV